MQDDKLAKLEAVLGEMTARPWRHAQHDTHEVEAQPNVLVACCGTIGHAPNDARGIVALRNAAPELIAVARAAREMRAADMHIDDADEYVESREAFDRALAALDAKLGEVLP